MVVCWGDEDPMTTVEPIGHIKAVQFGANVRDYGLRDRDAVLSLLSFLPRLYPSGLDWLERRLTQIEQRRSHCTLAVVHSRIAGILIDTPKGLRSSKISTFFVTRQDEGRGIGSCLFEASARRWHAVGVDNIHVTVASCRRQKIVPFLLTKGFTESAIIAERYGPNRDEIVYSLKLN